MSDSERDEDEVSTAMSDIDDVVFFAFSVVRMSGVTNMLASVCTYVMCVLALWSRSDLAMGLNEPATFLDVSKRGAKGLARINSNGKGVLQECHSGETI
jgi:hypothetical protein